MSLENELVELNMAYQSCQSANEGLRDRLHELEQLVKEYQALVEDIPDESTNNVDFLAWETRRMELQQRATAALSQE